MANNALDELQKNATPNQGEIWLVRNDFKMPFADQMSLGVRQALGSWNMDVSLSNVHAKNQFIWFGGNRDPNGGWGTQSPIDPLWGGPNGYGSLVLGDFVGDNKTRSVFLKADKPYSSESGWGLTVAYTYTDAQTNARNWDDDIFNWTYGRDTAGLHTSRLVDKHRLVAAGFIDLPWQMQLGGKAVYASGMPRQLTNCSGGFPTSTTPGHCVYTEGDTPSFRQVDVSITKGFTFGAHTVSLRADVLNLFNTANYGGFDDWIGGPGNANAYGGDNPNLGKPNAIRGDTRTLRVRLSYAF